MSFGWSDVFAVTIHDTVPGTSVAHPIRPFCTTAWLNENFGWSTTTNVGVADHAGRFFARVDVLELHCAALCLVDSKYNFFNRMLQGMLV